MAYSKLKIDIKDIVRSTGFPSLKQWVKEWSEDHISDFLYLIILDIVNFMNVGKTMDSIQIDNTVKLILSKHPDLSMEDLKVWSDNFKTGHYGTSYDRVDGKCLLETLAIYKIERLEWIENDHLNQKSSSPVIENMSIDLLKAISDLPAIQEAKKEEYTPRIPSNRTATDLDKRIQFLYKMFDRIYRKNKVMINGHPTSIKMVEIKGKKYDMPGFVEMMLMRKR